MAGAHHPGFFPEAGTSACPPGDVFGAMQEATATPAPAATVAATALSAARPGAHAQPGVYALKVISPRTIALTTACVRFVACSLDFTESR